MAKRKVVFFVPCNGINMAVTGIFNRVNLFAEVECTPFDFDSARDIKKLPTGNDHGVWKNAHQYLGPLVTSYEKAVILIDAQFPGSPGSEVIEQDIINNMISMGWNTDDFKVAVFDPELEALMWNQDNTILSGVIRFSAHDGGLSQWLLDEGWVGEGEVLPTQPKEALEAALKLNVGGRNIRLSVVCKHVAEQIDLEQCINDPFAALVEQFKNWCPVERV